MCKVSQNQGKQKNVRDSEEFELNGSRDIEVQLYFIYTYVYSLANSLSILHLMAQYSLQNPKNF